VLAAKIRASARRSLSVCAGANAVRLRRARGDVARGLSE
jgi:hypothetical protein